MEQKVIESLDGVTVYPVISLVVFILFFVVILIWMIKADKNYIKTMSDLPLEDNSLNSGLEKNLNLKG